MADERFRRASKIGEYEVWVKELLEKIEKGELKEVPMNTIQIDTQFSQFRDESAVLRLSESFKRRHMWFNYPIVQKNTMLCISGNHRVLAAKNLGHKSITVRLVDVTGDECWAIRIEENSVRRKVSKKELYYMFRKARDEWGWEQKMVAEFVGLSQGRVSQILGWGDSGFVEKPKILETNIGRESGGPRADAAEGYAQGTPAANPDIPSEIPPQPTPSDGESDSGKGRAGGADASGVPIRPVEERASSSAANPPSLDSLPETYWTIEDVMLHQGRINGCIREAAKHTSKPAIRVWLESLYAYVKDALGYDK